MKVGRIGVCSGLFATVALLASTGQAVTYSGALNQADGGLITSGNWNGSTFGWTVTSLADGWWSYQYSWNFDRPELSHLILEVSENSDFVDDFRNWQFSGVVEASQTFGPGPSNPGVPGSIFGFKINADDGLTTFSFESSRVPVWGDFYAKAGSENGGNVAYAYNAGFTAPDPLDPAANGSILNHILRPDTITNVPDGGATVTLLGMAMLALGWISRRKALLRSA